MSAGELVTQKFTEAMYRVADSYGTTKDQLAAIEDFLTGLTPLEIFPVFNDPEFVRYILATGEKPVAPTLSFPDMTIPDLTAPIPGFNYSDSPYSSELREALKTELIDGVENGGNGLGPVIETAMTERDRLRREQALADAKDRISADWADGEAGDLGLPDGALAAQYIAVETEHLQKEQTVSYDTMTKMAELARQQQEVYLKTGTELENVMETKHTADMGRALEAARVEPEILIRGFEAAMMKVKVMGEVYNALAAKANAQATIFKSQMDGYLADVEVGSKEIDASVKKYDADVKGAAAESEAFYRTDANRIEQIKNYLALRMEGLKSLAQLSAQVCAAMATSVSASASVGDQVTSSYSESESTSTNHNYQHNDDRDYM